MIRAMSVDPSDLLPESALPAVAEIENDATDRALPAGPATIGWEILEQCPECAEIYVPVGDSALIRGVAAAVHARRPTVRVIGVQAEAAPSYYLSWRQGRVVTTETCNTIADVVHSKNFVSQHFHKFTVMG
ncbi:MAG TPA: pyridoxal-phosphate dependent enzyme [Vicinamibacterales bacterium]|nr:pyridoxal-phosphate dependent enzyme [Vicinamibacterales bacterium]